MIRRMLLVAAVLLSLAVPVSSQAGPFVVFCPYTLVGNGSDFVEIEGCVAVTDSFIVAGSPVNMSVQGRYASVVAGAYVLRPSNTPCAVATVYASGVGQLGGTRCLP